MFYFFFNLFILIDKGKRLQEIIFFILDPNGRENGRRTWILSISNEMEGVHLVAFRGQFYHF
jgi:hypothetical protein